MARTKSGSSAAQRREQTRQQRQSNHTATRQQHQRERQARQQKQRNSNWLWVVGTLVLVVIIVGVFVYLSHQPAPGSTGSSGSSTKEVMQNITNIDPSSLTTVGTGGVQNPMKVVSGSSGTPLVGPNGKPEFFYAGAEYCPYCAAQRWGMIVALSRFGTFSGVSELTSSEDNLSTFSFHGSHYTSQYIDFVPVELYDNQDKPLETPTSVQQKLIQTYDSSPYTTSPGAIPFIDIANKFVSTGAYYSATDISSLSWTDIAGQVQDTNTQVSKDILGTANYLTAAICVATDNQPASVCSTAPVTQIEPTLPKVSANEGHGQLALVAYTGDIETKRSI